MGTQENENKEGVRQMTIPREEFNQAMARIHDKLDIQKDHFESKFVDLKTNIVEIKTKQETFEIPLQPCKYIDSHLAEHKKNKNNWTKPVIVGLIVTAFIFIQEPIKAFIKHLMTEGG